jgi:hypothetical protein
MPIPLSKNMSYGILNNRYSKLPCSFSSRNLRSTNNYWDIRMCASKNTEEYKQPDN